MQPVLYSTDDDEEPPSPSSLSPAFPSTTPPSSATITSASSNVATANTKPEGKQLCIRVYPSRAHPVIDRVPAGAIAGGVVGGVALFGLLGLCLTLFCRRRRRRPNVVLKDTERTMIIIPFPPSTTAAYSNPFASNWRPRRTRPPPVSTVSQSMSPPSSTATSSSFACAAAAKFGSGKEKKKEKTQAIASLPREDLRRGVELPLRQQVMTLRAERSQMGPLVAESDSTLLEPDSNTTVSTLALPRLTTAEVHSQLRMEVAALRGEMARLRAESQALGLISIEDLHTQKRS